VEQGTIVVKHFDDINFLADFRVNMCEAEANARGRAKTFPIFAKV
jgi:hypothetical protein